MRRSVAAAALACGIGASGCNAILGLDEVSLREGGGAAGSGGQPGLGGGGGTSPTTGPGGAGGTGGAGDGGQGGAPDLFQCGEIGFDSDLILYGDMDTDDWGGSNTGGGLDDVGGQCQGAWYMAVAGSMGGPPGGGYLWSDGEPGPLVANPCLSWRIAARDPLGSGPTFWLLFDFGELGVNGTIANLLTPDGVVADSTDWKFFAGVCKVSLPTPVETFADVRIYVQGEVYLDAFEGHAVACEADTPDCAGV